MKTLKYMLIVAVSLVIGFSDTALARPNVSVSFSFGGRRSFNRSCRTDYRFDHRPRHFEPARWNYRPHQPTIILGGGYWYDRRPSCYVVTSPVVVERPPVIVEK
ncbi:MAG: hypothetical protein JW947_06540, partial [Sedimentisphaerales bacterium]|nr:hypothetical protein [Sedimentisphaerales bacterium]